MKNCSIRKLYFFVLFSNIFAILGGIACIVFLTACCLDLFKNSHKTIVLIAFVIIITIFAILVIFLTKYICKLLKDLNAVKNKNYITIIAQVKRFKKNVDPDSGRQSNTRPIVSVVNTKDELELNINDEIILGETYKFNYLKNSHIAEIVERVE